MAKIKSLETTSLDESLKALTALIDKMEQNDTKIDDSLLQFEQGVNLIRHAQKKLQQAEQKIQILIKKDSDEKLQDYQDL